MARLGGGSGHGRASWPRCGASYLEGWINAFNDLRIHTEVIGEDGDDVRTEIRFTGHGSESGVPLDEWVAFTFSIREGRVTQVDDLGREGLQASTK